MDKVRNPNPRGEGYSPMRRGGEATSDDDIVEGHSMSVNRPRSGPGDEPGTEDVEGHRPRPRVTGDEEADVEGHRKMRVGPDEDDVEGHRKMRVGPDEDDVEGHRKMRVGPDEDDVEGHGTSKLR